MIIMPLSIEKSTNFPSAHECCRGLRDKNLRGMRIALLGPRIRRTLYKAEKKKVWKITTE